jgi:hypothetical protein
MRSFSELTAQEKALEVLRWALVPVACVAAVLLMSLLAGMMIAPMMAQTPGAPVQGPDYQRMAMQREIGVLTIEAFDWAGAK